MTGRHSIEKDHLLRPQGHGRDKAEQLCGSYRLLVTLLLMLALMLCFTHQSSMGSTMICMVVDDAGDLDPPHVDDDLPNDTEIIRNATVPGDSGVYEVLDGEEGGVNFTFSPMYVMGNVSSTPAVVSSSTSSSRGNGSSVLPLHKYDWDKTTQGWVHSSLFIGYYVVQLPSGFLATRYGGKRVIIYGLLVSSVAQLLTPWAATVGVVCLCLVRGLCGFATGFIYAPVFGILANWVPTEESSLLFGLAGTGIELGTVVSFLMSALVCDLDVMGGWPLMYYIIGCAGVVMVGVLYCLVSDLPSQNRWISRGECHHIETLIGRAGGHGHKDKDDDSPLTKTIPLRNILTSLPVWAVVISQVGSDWLYYLLITVMPSFMQEVMHMDNTVITLLTGLPFLGIIGIIYVAGSLADFLRKRQIVSTSHVRKLSDFVCKILPGALLVSLGFLGPGQEAVFVALYVLTCLLSAFIYMSWVTNPVDLSPVYTGFIASISETGAMWVAIVVPVIVENITKDKTAEQWQYVLYVTGGIQVVTFIFYCLFQSSELQPWGAPDSETTVSASPRPSTDADAAGLSDGSAHDLHHPRGRSTSKEPRRYRSHSLIGQGRLYRSVSPFVSDVEDPHRRQRKDSAPDTFYHRGAEKVQANGHVRAWSSKQSLGTSEIDPDYITMTWIASSEESAELEGTSYESMNFNDTRPHGHTHTTTFSEDDEPIYENVMVGLPDSHRNAAVQKSVSSGHPPGNVNSKGAENISTSLSQYGSMGRH